MKLLKCLLYWKAKKKKEKKFLTKSNSFQEMYATYDWDLLINEYVFSLYSDTRATKDHL